jgi:hypothetical protein
MIPIFVNYNYTEKPIGYFDEGKVTLTSPLCKETIFSIFGNIGFQIIESEIQDKVVYIKKFNILCWSITPQTQGL